MNGSVPTASERPVASTLVVLGSLNEDFVVTVAQIPRPGETVLGGSVTRLPGGKGANQAAVAARLGGDVRLIGRVGADDFGEMIRAGLANAGLDLGHIRTLQHVGSGLAFVTVDEHGENAIVVSPGANARFGPAELEVEEIVLEQARIAVAQLETPLETVDRFAQLCEKHGVDLILNVAPYHDLSPDLLRRCRYLILNREEATSLTKTAVKTRADAYRALARAGEKGVRNIIITLGGDGCVALTEAGYLELDAYQVQVVDTTGAGDAFVGAFALALSRQESWAEALKFAGAAGAVTCAHVGAQQSDGIGQEIQDLLDLQPQAPRHRPVLQPSS